VQRSCDALLAIRLDSLGHIEAFLVSKLYLFKNGNIFLLKYG